MWTKLHWVSQPQPWPGRLALAARPRGGEWLEDELGNWKRDGVDCVISLLEPEEESSLSLTLEQDLARQQGLAFVSFPIVDRNVPGSPQAAGALIQQLRAFLTAGRNIVIHCRHGVGRSGLVAACLLVSEGDSPETAIQELTAVRGVEIPETPAQRRWIEQFNGR